MAESKLIAVLVVALSFSIAACSRRLPLPEEQMAFSVRLHELQAQHSKARSTNNDLQIEAVEAKARRFFNDPPRIEAWRGTISGVNTFAGAQWASAEAGDVVYQLKPADAKVAAKMKRYSKGDWVQFSGDVKFETNLTIGQAIRNPELVVYVFEVDPYWEEGKKVAR